jgi:hypothetical protein
MEIKQIRLAKMATFCYLIGDCASKTCALIDPAFETGRILEKVRENDFRVTHIINTMHTRITLPAMRPSRQRPMLRFSSMSWMPGSCKNC